MALHLVQFYTVELWSFHSNLSNSLQVLVARVFTFNYCCFWISNVFSLSLADSTRAATRDKNNFIRTRLMSEIIWKCHYKKSNRPPSGRIKIQPDGHGNISAVMCRVLTLYQIIMPVPRLHFFTSSICSFVKKRIYKNKWKKML